MTAASESIAVGSLEVPRSTARQSVVTYTTPAPDVGAKKADYYAWPYYDRFESSGGADELTDGDLLTPVLLNVNPGIHGFATLQALRPALEERLRHVPPGVQLASATDDDIESVARLFGLLDEVSAIGVRGTTLSKVLHRKRPHLIPLHDRHIWSAYVPSPVPTAKRRGWAEYMTALMRAMRRDLSRSHDTWKELTQIPATSEAILTPLRALDIVAWREGKRGATRQT